MKNSINLSVYLLFATLFIGCANSSTSEDQTPRNDSIMEATIERIDTLSVEEPQAESGEVFDLVIGTYAGSTESVIKELHGKGFTNSFDIPVTDDKGKPMKRVVAERTYNKDDALRVKESLEQQGVTAWIWQHEAGSSDVVSSKRQDSKYKCVSPYTRVRAKLGEDFPDPNNEIKIYKKPDKGSSVLGTLGEDYRGPGEGVLIEHTNRKWDKIRVGKTIGFVESAKVDYECFGCGEESVIIAAKTPTTIYRDCYADDDCDEDGLYIDDYVEEGTIISSDINVYYIDENGQKWYTLMTMHDYLYVKASDVKIVSR